jgi:hypothetical protein
MTFREFWPLYLQAHSAPGTRAVHYGATVIGVGSAAATVATGEVFLLGGIGLAYGLAIAAHRWIEKNQSLIRVNPAWGALADLRMFWLAVTGGLAREIEKTREVSPGERSVMGARRPALGSLRNEQGRGLLHR